jgi:anti-sigma regulatory factor (Ser/Thr protein kinase)
MMPGKGVFVMSQDTDPWSLDLRGTEDPALVEVRRWAARNLGALDDGHLGDVMLVATELVTNAYDHGNGALRVQMSHTSAPCRVRIEVDDSCREPPRLTRVPGIRPHGRGMLIVDRLAEDWGVRQNHDTGGKTVWAEVSCAGDGSSPCGPQKSLPPKEGRRR